MTNFRVLHSSLKGFWGRLRYSCSLPPSLPPLPSHQIWKQHQAQHPYKLYCHSQVLGCAFCGTSTLHGMLGFCSFGYISAQTPNTTWAPPEQTPSCPPGDCLDTQHNLHSLTAAWKTNVTETFYCRHPDKATIFFLTFHRDVSKDLCIPD